MLDHGAALRAGGRAARTQIALVHGDERIAWRELVERVERLAHGLAERGIGAGDAVGLVLRDDPWFVTCFHAITALGAIVVPVNPGFKQTELEFCFRSAGVRGIISDERTAGVCERIAAGFDDARRGDHDDGRPRPGADARGAGRALRAASGCRARDPDEVFVYQFSSGSTGRPKRVPRTHGADRRRGGPLRRSSDVGAGRPRLQRDPAVPHLGHGRAACSRRRRGARRS